MRRAFECSERNSCELPLAAPAVRRDQMDVPRFRYALQPALEAARAGEAEARLHLVGARSRLEAEHAKLRALEARVREVRATEGSAVSAPRLAARLVDLEHCLAAFSAIRRGALAAAGRASFALSAKQIAYETSAQRRTALQRHRDGQYAAFRLELERREAAETDEANGRATRHAGLRL